MTQLKRVPLYYQTIMTTGLSETIMRPNFHFSPVMSLHFGAISFVFRFSCQLVWNMTYLSRRDFLCSDISINYLWDGMWPQANVCFISNLRNISIVDGYSKSTCSTVPHYYKNAVSAFQISCNLLSFTSEDSWRN